MLSIILILIYPIVAILTFVISYEIRLRRATNNFDREQANISASIDAVLWPIMFPLYSLFIINRLGYRMHRTIFGGR